MKGLFAFLLIFPVLSFAQEKAPCYCSEKTLVKESEDGFIRVEEAPVYPGGQDKLLEFIKDNIKFDVDIEGKLLLRFIVNCKGAACGFELENKEGNIPKESEGNIISVLSKMEKWEPGKQRGKPADIPYKLPIEIKNGKVMF